MLHFVWSLNNPLFLVVTGAEHCWLKASLVCTQFGTEFDPSHSRLFKNVAQGHSGYDSLKEAAVKNQGETALPIPRAQNSLGWRDQRLRKDDLAWLRWKEAGRKENS